MDNININTIKAMPKEDLDALNRKLMGRLAMQMVGFVFMKVAVAGVLRTITKKALIEAAKRA